MTNAEIAARVARKLTVVHCGDFYVGQRVRHALVVGAIGTIMHFYDHHTGEPSAMCTWNDSDPVCAFLKNLRAIES